MISFNVLQRHSSLTTFQCHSKCRSELLTPPVDRREGGDGSFDYWRCRKSTICLRTSELAFRPLTSFQPENWTPELYRDFCGGRHGAGYTLANTPIEMEACDSDRNMHWLCGTVLYNQTSERTTDEVIDGGRSIMHPWNFLFFGNKQPFLYNLVSIQSIYRPTNGIR